MTVETPAREQRPAPWAQWALWSVLVLALLVCPALVAGPMLAYVLDPELLVLAMLFGTQSGRMELGVFWLRLRVAGDRVRRRGRTGAQRPAPRTHPAARRTSAPAAARGPRGTTRPGRQTRAPVRPRPSNRSRSVTRPG